MKYGVYHRVNFSMLRVRENALPVTNVHRDCFRILTIEILILVNITGANCRLKSAFVRESKKKIVSKNVPFEGRSCFRAALSILISCFDTNTTGR